MLGNAPHTLAHISIPMTMEWDIISHVSQMDMLRLREVKKIVQSRIKRDWNDGSKGRSTCLVCECYGFDLRYWDPRISLGIASKTNTVKITLSEAYHPNSMPIFVILGFWEKIYGFRFKKSHTVTHYLVYFLTSPFSWTSLSSTQIEYCQCTHSLSVYISRS